MTTHKEEITKEQEAKYLKCHGNICPFCESLHVTTTSSMDQDGGIAWQNCKCLDCEKEWDDMYKLISVHANEVTQ